MECLYDRINRHFIKIEDSSEVDYRVRIHIDNSAHGLYLNKLGELNYTPTVISYCTTEKGTIRSKKYILNGNIVINPPTQEALWILNNDATDITFLGRESAINNFHRNFYIFFEHIITKKCIEKGAVMIHSAAVKAVDGVVLYIGKKRAGKTTLFFESCGRRMMQPISVDKTLICREGDKLIAYGVPTRLRVLAGTLSKYEELNHFVPEKFRNVDSHVLWRGESDGKIEMCIGDFEKFAHTKFVPFGQLAKIVACSIKQENTVPIKKVGFDSFFLNSLRNSIYSPDNPEEDWWSEIGLRKRVELQKNTEEILNDIQQNIEGSSYFASSDLNDLYLYN